MAIDPTPSLEAARNDLANAIAFAQGDPAACYRACLAYEAALLAEARKEQPMAPHKLPEQCFCDICVSMFAARKRAECSKPAAPSPEPAPLGDPTIGEDVVALKPEPAPLCEEVERLREQVSRLDRGITTFDYISHKDALALVAKKVEPLEEALREAVALLRTLLARRESGGHRDCEHPEDCPWFEDHEDIAMIDAFLAKHGGKP